MSNVEASRIYRHGSFHPQKMDGDPELTKFAQRYADAWCSQDPDKVAAFYAKNGSISVNGGSSVPIAEVARAFMRDFPDMVVTFDKLENVPTVPNSIGHLPERTPDRMALEILFG
jgi:hypothetical protein